MTRARRPLPVLSFGLVLLSPLALGGCGAVVARTRAEQSPASAVPGERTPTAAELGLPAAGPVALADLVRTAVRVHPTAVGARAAARAAAARVREAEGDRLPQVTTSTSAGAREQGGPARSRTGTQRFVSNGLDVSWLLFDFGRTSALVRQAGAEWLAAQADARTAEVGVAFGVRSAWFDLVKQLEVLAVDREAVRQFQEHLDQVRAQVKAGTRIPYDESKAGVDLGNARAAEVQARDAVETARATLATDVGLAEPVGWVPAPAAAQPVPATFEAAWAEARLSQPALAAATARERAASALVDARVAELYPSVALELGLSQSGSSTPLPWSFQVGPAVRWTPFDGARNLATIDEAVADLRQSRTERALAEQQTWLDVRTAWSALLDARERVTLTALTAEDAQENLRLAQVRFDAGIATSVELTDARVALTQARTARAQAQADESIAGARLARAAGIAVRGAPPAPTPEGRP